MSADPDRWHPDQQLIPAVLAGSRRRMGALDRPDQCWVVAGLTTEGMSADEIADRLTCSRRLVNTLRADPMTAVCAALQAESAAFADEMRLLRSEHGRLGAELAAALAEADRLRRQLVVLTGGPPACRKCGTPMDRYNAYRHPKTGKVQCRSCHRKRQATYRTRSTSAA